MPAHPPVPAFRVAYSHWAEYCLQLADHVWSDLGAAARAALARAGVGAAPRDHAGLAAMYDALGQLVADLEEDERDGPFEAQVRGAAAELGACVAGVCECALDGEEQSVAALAEHLRDLLAGGALVLVGGPHGPLARPQLQDRYDLARLEELARAPHWRTFSATWDPATGELVVVFGQPEGLTGLRFVPVSADQRAAWAAWVPAAADPAAAGAAVLALDPLEAGLLAHGVRRAAPEAVDVPALRADLAGAGLGALTGTEQAVLARVLAAQRHPGDPLALLAASRHVAATPPGP